MVNVGVIGCGAWGPNHVRVFSSLPGVRVVAVADTSKARLAKMVEAHPHLRAFEHARELLTLAEVDAVVVATPTSTHFSLVKEALERGKHVLCEKPLCERSPDADELAALATRQRLVLMVGHVFLYNAGIVKIKSLLDAGELGALHYLAAVRTNLGPIRSDVNAAYDLASHDVSVFNWLVGAEPETVAATGQSFLQRGVEDVVFLNLRYPGGVIANVHASWLNPQKVRQMTVVCSGKMLTWDDTELSTPIAIYDKGVNVSPETSDYGQYLRFTMWDNEIRLPKIAATEPLRAQDEAFVEAVRARAGTRSDGAFAAGVVRVLEAAQASLRQGGAPVQVRGGPAP